MIRTFTHRSSANAQRLRQALHQTQSAANRRALAYNPELELSPQEQEILNGATYSLTEDRIAQILSLVGRR